MLDANVQFVNAKFLKQYRVVLGVKNIHLNKKYSHLLLFRVENSGSFLLLISALTRKFYCLKGLNIWDPVWFPKGSIQKRLIGVAS